MVTSRHGFTLAEVLVALLLISFGALGLAAMAAQVTRSTRRSLEIERAVARASWVMDSLLSVPPVSAGSDRAGDLRIEWSPAATGVLLTRVLDRTDNPLVSLYAREGLPLPDPPVGAGPR
ncbi:MAG: prepilin-type N-terminal cleavage/methylation domain-containing protein [Gemmatimonadota bacterium]